MARRISICVGLGLWLLIGCSNGRHELAIPKLLASNAASATVSPIFAELGGVPEGVQITFVGDTVTLRGVHMRSDMKFFLGMNIDLARAPDSIYTTPRHLLPGTPFVYKDPVTGVNTILEVEAQVEFTTFQEVRISIPPAVACNSAFTNPIIRMFGADGSSEPVTDVLHIVGPQCVALTPSKGVDIGGFDTIVHGFAFSPYTQIAVRYPDPATGEIKVLGNTPETDINELFIDEHTLVIPNFPGIVPNSTLGLAEELKADVLLFENIDAIAGNAALEPSFGGDAPCDSLRPESPRATLFSNGVRNTEKINGFTFLPTGVTDYPDIVGVLPESGSEVGGNTVVIDGFQFDAFSTDLNPANPGIGIECPPDSGNYIAPLEATLIDRNTLIIKMPPCPVDIPEKVNFCIRNKYSLDRPNTVPAAGANADCVIFEDVYTYIPVPPIQPPLVTAIYPANSEGQGLAHDYGLDRLLVVGDWFDADTELNGGFELLLPNPLGGNPIPVQTVRTILHNRNLIEIYTPRLPAPFYPLTEDLLVGVRARNSVGFADFDEVLLVQATPDAVEPPVLDSVCAESGPLSGGNDVLLIGSNFDTSTQVFFGGIEATDVQFINSSLLSVKAPSGANAGLVQVTAVDDGVSSAGAGYTYFDGASRASPVIGFLDPNSGSEAGGYSILVFGGNLTPTTQVEFGVDTGNISHEIFFVNNNLLRVVVPEAQQEQVGIPIGVGATDPLVGITETVKTVEFTYILDGGAPEILFVDTTVEVPITPTDLPALKVGGGDRMLVIGRNFDQSTTFDIEKPQKSDDADACTDVRVLSSNIAVMFSPASPDGEPGLADLQAHSNQGDSNEFPVEYVEPGPPVIIDVRNLDDGTQTAPIDGNDRILIFGDNFFAPLTVRLTGRKLGEPSVTTFVDVTNVTLVEDHIIGVDIPRDTFAEGPLEVTVTTDYGVAEFNDDNGDPIFTLVGPQPPIVTGVFESKFISSGGEEAVFFGRHFTASTAFSVRTELMPANSFEPVLATRIVSDTVAIVTMPLLLGGMPPAGASGDVRAIETSAALAQKINGDPFTVATNLFAVCNENSPMLLAVYPDCGLIDGGEQVVLFGQDFLTATGDSNIKTIRFFDEALGENIGAYNEATQADLPLTTDDRGKFVILNDHEVLLITNAHAKISPDEAQAAVNVIVESDQGNSQLSGGYTYKNTPAVRTPRLLGITPNETRLNGGTTHLLAGAFLTEADRIVFTRTSDSAKVTVAASDFAEVSDTFLVFTMPNLTSTFDAGDVLDVHAEKDFNGDVLVSNALKEALRVTFAGPPIITPTLDPAFGGAFGGNVVEIKGALFTSNSQVLFGTIPASVVVYAAQNRLLVIAPSLPLDAPDPGVDLQDLTAAGTTVDIAVFTQGGWAVLKNGYKFNPQPPVVDDCTPTQVAETKSTQITLKGDYFLPNMTITPTIAGATVTNIVVDGFTTAHFTYNAPTLAMGSAPLVDKLTVATSHGAATMTCDLTILPDPEFETGDDACESTFTNDHASPTTGVFASKLVEVTLKGTGFTKGGSMTVKPRQGAAIPLTEIDGGDAFTASGQFKVVDNETMVFTPPSVFSSQVPTAVDGNPNVGFAIIKYTNPQGQSATLEDCFRYVPVLGNFTSFAFSVPAGPRIHALPETIDVGDINADGLPDAVAYTTAGDTLNDDADAFIFFADSFGDGVDVNGDGQSPDFAGTFTTHAVLEDSVRGTFTSGRHGVRARLANLDDDDQLEIVISSYTTGPANAARILIVDIKSDGTVGSHTVITPGTTNSLAVVSIAVGNFDDTDDRDDIAFITTATVATDRRIGVLCSTGTDFVFDEILQALPTSMANNLPAELVAGDLDKDGDDDLMWGCSEFSFGGSTHAGGAPIYVFEVDVDHTGGTIGTADEITNLKVNGGDEIELFDVDGDGDLDAVVINSKMAYSSDTTLFTGGSRDAGFAVILDPLSTLKADSFQLTGFITFGRHGAIGDLNADGITDLVVCSNYGEFIPFWGDGKGGFINSGRSFQLNTVARPDKSRSHGIAAVDMNNDGLAEIFMSDLGVSPVSLQLWVNESR